jgi:hypothetical protein
MALLSLFLLANSMTKPMAGDEQMGCAAGYQLSKGLLVYRDFPYATQLPYYPLFCAVLFKLSGTTYYLLTARLFSVLFDILIIFCIVSIFRKIFGQYTISGTLLGLVGAALFVFNPFVGLLCGLGWNHDLVLFCIVLSFRLFLGIDSNGKSDLLRIAAIASLLTIAVWTRITTVFVVPLFLVMLIIIPVHSANMRFKYALSFLISTIIFSLWPIWVILSQPRAFYLNVFQVSLLNSVLLHRLGIAYNRVPLTIMALRTEEFLLLILAAVFLWVYIFICRRKLVFAQTRNAVFALLLTAAAFVITYFPPTMWKQYFGIPVVFVIIATAFGLRILRTMPGHRDRISIHFQIWLIVFLALALTTAGWKKPVTKISRLWKMDNWTPIQIHKISHNIVARAKGSKLILTLSPLYAIEGGGQIYREFSAGNLAYRIAHNFSESDRAITHTAGLPQLPALMEKTPPDAIIISPELTRFDKIDLKSIIPPDWQLQDCGQNNLRAYFPP